MIEKTDIKSLSKEELQEQVKQMGEKAFRANQMYAWMHQKMARSFDEMTNISKQCRALCKERFVYTALELVQVSESATGGVKKYLFRLHDGELIEAVLMPQHYGNSVCISSQAGCRMGCSFCASAIGQFARNLAVSEMLDQVYAISLESEKRISHVVVMGVGEPLDNYENVLRFIRMLTDEDGLHLSGRHLSISTCGLIPQLYALAEEAYALTLAISLHAPTDALRRELMPVAKSYTMQELMDACAYYFQKTKRRLTFEYCLIEGKNDTETEAKELAGLIKPLHAHVNLIPMNEIAGSDLKRSKQKNIQNFKKMLEKYEINVTIRKEKGVDIEGACGQLRSNHLGRRMGSC